MSAGAGARAILRDALAPAGEPEPTEALPEPLFSEDEDATIAAVLDKVPA